MAQEKELEEFKYIFGLLDKDGDGIIASKQLKEIMKEISFFVPGDDFEAFFKAHQVPNQVDFDIFINVLMDRSLQPTPSQEEIIAAFEIFDSEGNGKIDSREMRLILDNIGGSSSFTNLEIDKFIERAEGEGQKIDYVEFTKKMFGKMEQARSLIEQV